MAPAERIAELAVEYDLGELRSARPLAGGSDSVMRIATGRGTFVVKRASRIADVELQARAAAFLADRGIRQPRIYPAADGAFVTADGWFLQEFLPGEVALRPGEYQVRAAMRHVGAFHRVLAGLPVEYQPDNSSVFQRVADPDYLVRELPGLLARNRLGGAEELAALATLDQFRHRLSALPRQVVHGDIAPDNVLMQGDEVVSIIDFTPHYDSALFGACTTLYWYHVHGRPEPAVSQLSASAEAIGSQRPWTDEELSLLPAGLLREALRRLATPLALANESGTAPGPSLATRHRALLAVARLPAPDFTRS